MNSASPSAHPPLLYSFPPFSCYASCLLASILPHPSPLFFVAVLSTHACRPACLLDTSFCFADGRGGTFWFGWGCFTCQVVHTVELNSKLKARVFDWGKLVVARGLGAERSGVVELSPNNKNKQLKQKQSRNRSHAQRVQLKQSTKQLSVCTGRPINGQTGKHTHIHTHACIRMYIHRHTHPLTHTGAARAGRMLSCLGGTMPKKSHAGDMITAESCLRMCLFPAALLPSVA